MVSNIKRICFRILTTLRFLQVMGETVRGRRSLEDKMRIKVFFHSSLQSMETEKRLVSQAVEDVESQQLNRIPEQVVAKIVEKKKLSPRAARNHPRVPAWLG